MATQLAAAKDSETDDHRRLYKHMEAWLRRDATAAPFRDHDDGLMEAIVDAEQHEYLIAQAEALAYLSWLKKFAVAYLSSPKGDTP
jgi:CRISPR-associated protein Cmr5